MNDAAYQTANCWLWPKIVFGDMRTTRRLCKKVAQKSLANQAWCWPEGVAEFTDVRDSETAIVVERALHGYAPDRRVALWRPYWVAELDDITDNWNSDDGKISTGMLVDGMRSLWFAVGMLRFSARFQHAQQYQPLFEHYVYWLPEIETLSPRFRREGQGSEMFWAIDILRCAYKLGYIEQSQAACDKALREMTASGSILQWLLANGVITPDGSRYVLTPPPPSATTK